MIAVYVDDVLMAGESENIKTFKKQFRITYKIKELGKLKRHLGVWYEWIKDDKESMVKILMDDMTRKIVKEYKKITNGTVKEWNSPGYPSITLTKPENEDEIYKQDKYRSMVGKVMYLVNKSNPTCLNIVRELAKHFNNPMKQHWKASTRLIGYIRSDIGKGRILRKPKELRLIAFTESDYTNDEDRKSVTGGVVTVGGSPTYFKSKMQATVTLSSTEAEYMDLGTVTQEVLFQAQILDELFREEHKRPSIIYEDNLGAIYLTKNPQISQRTKHMDVRHHFIRDLIKDKKIEVRYVKGENNLTDIFTKNVKEEIFEKHVKMINKCKVKYKTKEEKVKETKNEFKENGSTNATRQR